MAFKISKMETSIRALTFLVSLKVEDAITGAMGQSTRVSLGKECGMVRECGVQALLLETPTKASTKTILNMDSEYIDGRMDRLIRETLKKIKNMEKVS